MTTEKFNEVIEAQILLSKEVLVDKAKEYATEDRLHNFKVAAELEGITTAQALAGMMAKHTVSIYDLCRVNYSYSNKPMWIEKITDHINYLLLLRAVIEEDPLHLTMYADNKIVDTVI